MLETRRTVSGIVYAVRSSQQVALPAADSESSSILLSLTLELFSSKRQEVEAFFFFFLTGEPPPVKKARPDLMLIDS